MSLFTVLKNNLPKFAYLNGTPAALIDELYRTQSNKFFPQLVQAIIARMIFVFLFLPLTVLDTIVNGVIALTYSLRSLFVSDEVQDNRLQQQKIYASNFSKSLYALLAAPLGLINPKLLILYFVPPLNDSVIRAGGNYHYASNAVLKSPESVEEVQQLIKNAVKEGKKVIPRGAGFSQGMQFISDKEELIVIDLNKLNTVEIHAKEKQAIVGAGAIWSAVKQEANKFKLALKVMQASDVFSVGGSIGTNIHGWNIHDGMLSTVLSAMTIINAQGELEELTPNDAAFHYVTGGLGLYGIIVSATINLTDNELLYERGVLISLQDYVHHFRNNVQNDSDVRMHLYRLSISPNQLLQEGVAVSYIKQDKHLNPICDTLQPEGAYGARFNRVMINAARHFSWLRRLYWAMEREQLVANKSPVMSVNKIMQPPINAMFNSATSESEWLQEYFLPEEQLAEFLNELSQLLHNNNVVLLNASVRFVKQNNKAPLSYAHDGDRFAVVLCFNQPLDERAIIKAQKWIRAAQHLSVELGGAYYLPYQHISSPDDFKRAYPHSEEACLAKEQLDSTHLFTSGFYQKHLNAPAKKINYFKTLCANEQNKTKFAGFLKNVLRRVDSDKFFALLEDILLYKDSHEDIYQELAHRLPEIAFDGLTDFTCILDSLAAIKKDLSAQAYTVLPQNIKTINGLVEIGYPGRFVQGFKQRYKVVGDIVAVYEQQSLTDYIQTGFPHPYNRFERLDYKKPNLKTLPDNSADVMTCYVGLHHFTDNELECFLADIRRVLRPSGYFLLVDHDINNEETLCMAHMAHTVFNCVTGVGVEEEMTEVRQFNSIKHWREKMAAHDLNYLIEGPEVPMIREGDPSRNRMVGFKNGGFFNTSMPDNRSDARLSSINTLRP